MKSRNKSKSNKSGKKSSKSSEENRFIYETVEFEVEIICGSFGSVKDGIETAFFEYYRDRDVLVVNLVEWEEAPACDNGGTGDDRVSRGKINQKLNRGEEGQRQGVQRIRIIPKRRKRHRRPRFGSSPNGRQQPQANSRDYDLVVALRSTGFLTVSNAKVTFVVEADCSPQSRACDGGTGRGFWTEGVCCGADGCDCGTVPSTSLCKIERCCVKNSAPFDQCYCSYVGPSCDTAQPCGPYFPTCATSSPAGRSDGPTEEPSGSAGPTGEPSVSAGPTGEPSGSPTGEPSGGPTGEPSGSAGPTGEPIGP